MKTCYLDCFSGISGDMTVGALIDAGADARELFGGLESLGTGAAFEVEKTKRRGIAASKFHVRGGETRRHRHLPHILEVIGRSGMPARAKASASAVFRRLGEAEAGVHGIPIEKVHFHEVGAVDSICDIAGACLALELLGVEEVVCSAINTGAGTANTEHGVLPVPAPATAALLTGKPIYARGPQFELTTPTGAAIATTLASEFGVMPPMRVIAVGYGAGDKEFQEHANVLRVLVGERTGAVESTTVSVIEANIDDSTPEVLGYAMERLLDSGAVLDVTLSPLMMKKNRQAVLLTVITRPEDRETAVRLIFAETSTLGLRLYPAERRVQSRRLVEVETGYGAVRIKVGESGAFAPEFEDCRTLAMSTGKPLKQVLADSNLAYLKSQK
jgi:pyridinium-3,5-bisthiocarboxylic acid mononucleotide nickel chelatase